MSYQSGNSVLCKMITLVFSNFLKSVVSTIINATSKYGLIKYIFYFYIFVKQDINHR